MGVAEERNSTNGETIETRDSVRSSFSLCAHAKSFECHTLRQSRLRALRLFLPALAVRDVELCPLDRWWWWCCMVHVVDVVT